MEKRVVIREEDPQSVQALIALDKHLAASGLSPIQRELIKIRASQINGCAFCISQHTRDARKLGETEQRIYLLDAWRETDFYSGEERAILALTEEVTHISKAGVTEETYRNVSALFGKKEVAALIMAIISINAWNRIAIATRMHPSLN